MRRILPFSLLHFLNDAISGYLIGSIATTGHGELEIVLAVLVYNVIAFGGQWFFAEFARHYLTSKQWILLSISLLIIAPFLFPFAWKISILLIGISSAIVHVEGATASYSFSGTARSLGLFAAPGIVGLALGGWLATMPFDISRLLALCSAGLMMLFTPFKWNLETKKDVSEKHGEIDTHDIVMILLLSAIALRSAVWNVFQMIERHDHAVLIWIAVAAAAGKIAGGVLSDRFGTRNYNLFALLTALPLLTLLRGHFFALISGIFLMQSTFGPTALLMMERFRKSPAVGAAHAFGTPILLGGILYLIPQKYWFYHYGVPILLATCILLLWIEKTKSKIRQKNEKSRLDETAL